jgi:hypothetical protein
MHEMTHVWQTTRSGRFYLPLMRHPFCRYGYQFEQGRPIPPLWLEQQASWSAMPFSSARDQAGEGRRTDQIEPILPFSRGGHSVT